MSYKIKCAFVFLIYYKERGKNMEELKQEILEDNGKNFLNKSTLTLTHHPKLSDFILTFADLISKYGDLYVDINSIKFEEISE